MRIRIVIFIVAVSFIAYNNLTEADRGDDGNIVDAGDLDVFSLRIGDCFNYGVIPEADEEAEEVEEVEAIPCSEPHWYETYALVTVDPSIETYPGQDEMFEIADEECLNRFENYVGRSFEESLLTYFKLVPTPESWSRANDRLLQCHLGHMEGEKLTGSMRGSGI